MCLTVNAMCTCIYNHGNYTTHHALEAPFAALLLSPVPLPIAPWPPANKHVITEMNMELFGSEPPISNLHIWPGPYFEIKPTYKLYQNINQRIEKGIKLPQSLATWPLTGHQAQALYVLIHGWTSEPRSSHVRTLRNALLLQNRHVHSLVINVDWKEAAADNYRRSAANTIVVGMDVGLLLFKLVRTSRYRADKIHVIGMDMGSHVATYAAYYYTALAIE